jgi:hypothetical protein
MTVDIDIPEVLAEMKAAFARYEDAIINNKVEVLNELFWKDDRTLRYGIAENLYGHGQIAGFRAARSPAGLARTLEKTQIHTFGRDFAVANTEFTRPSLGNKCGRQSQTWVRTPEGWRIVAAHVSVIDLSKS